MGVNLMTAGFISIGIITAGIITVGIMLGLSSSLALAQSISEITNLESDNLTASPTPDEAPLSLGQLMVQLFQNPSDLELNFRVMQAQIKEGN